MLAIILGKVSGGRYTIGSEVGRNANRAPHNRIESSQIGDGLSLGSHSTILDSILGHHCTISGHVGFRHSSAGDRIRIEADCEVNHSTLGSDLYIGGNCWLYDVTVGRCTYLESTVRGRNAVIGNYCSVAPGVTFGLGRHPLDGPGTSPLFYRGQTHFGPGLAPQDRDFEEFPPIHVGSDVWIGQDAIVMGGVKIGHGAVIGTRAVVTKDVPDFGVVAGVPARVVKYRFSPEIRNGLLELQWWNWTLEELRMRQEEVYTVLKETLS